MLASRYFTFAIMIALGLAAAMPSVGRSGENARQFALLVGCSVYPNLDKRLHLAGPANDVLLAKTLLIERFNFPEANVAVLSEQLGRDEKLPTRANIEREWKSLAAKAKHGDQLVVLMAGHGTQTPRLIADQGDLEPDGLDEIFLPRDVGQWNAAVGAVANGIKDDDIRDWIGAIRAKGANLWVIIDASHRGSGTRGAGDEMYRGLRPELLGVPREALEKAHSRTAHDDDEIETQLLDDEPELTRNATTPIPATDTPVLVALYAASTTEPTVEKRLPRRSKDRQYYGLLTYTLTEILSQADTKLTYRELVAQIHRQYVQAGRSSPTPVLEGNGVDRAVLGLKTLPDRPTIVVSGSESAGYQINAGGLHGLSVGSILTVYPPAGAENADQAIGNVRILADGFRATQGNVAPCAYEEFPPPQSLSIGMRCKPVYVDLGDQQLRVCVDTHADDQSRVADDLREVLRIELNDFANEHQHLVHVVENPADADWLLRYKSLDSKALFLTPVSGWQGRNVDALPPLFGPAPDGAAFRDWMSSALTKISRVQTLLRISGQGNGSAEAPAKLDVQIIRYKDPADDVGKPVPFGRGGIKLHDGDDIGFQVRNRAKQALDVTILLVDSSYGIYVLYPEEDGFNRVNAGGEVVRRGSIEANTTGLEHLIVLAVKGKSATETTSFACLSQTTIEQTQRAVGGKSMSSPLGKMYQQALYGKGKKRGFTTAEVGTFEIATLSWTTLP